MIKLKDTMDRIKSQEHVNKGLDKKLQKAKKKVEKLESSLAHNKGKVDKHYLAEFSDHTGDD